MSVENQWFVRMNDGRVVTVSLDDLDAAFQNGTIDESTLVFRHGMKEWLPLAEAAGLDDASPDDTHQDSVAPVAVSRPIAPAPMQTPDAYSVRPVAFDMSTNALDLDGDFEPQFKSSKKKFVFVGIAIAAVIGIGAVVSGALKGVDPAAASASLAPVATQVAAPPPAVADPPPQVSNENRLSDAQKAALVKFDDKTKADQAKKAQDRAAKAARSSGSKRRTKEKEVFVKGGNKYDPLNASL